MRVGAASALGLALVFAPSIALAGDPAAAREQLKIGYGLSQEGHCEEAIPHLEESLRLDVKAITLINLANCEERLGKLTEAVGHWVDARSRASFEGAAPIEDEAAKREAALEPRLARLTIRLHAGAPAGTTVTRDDLELGKVSLDVALPLNPGAHVVVVHAPKHADRSFGVTLAEGESKALDVALGDEVKVASPPPAPVAAPRARTSPLVYAGFGAAAVGVAAGAVMGLMALGAANTAKDACPDRACGDQGNLDAIDRGRTYGTISTIAFAVAGAGALVGIYGLVWGKKSSVTTAMRPGLVRGSF